MKPKHVLRERERERETESAFGLHMWIQVADKRMPVQKPLAWHLAARLEIPVQV